MKAIIAPIILLVCIAAACFGQDTVVKTDKSEIKCLVTEITETHIKYKKWDFQEGPTYSFSQNEVFMILYSNGKIEKFNAQYNASNSGNHTIEKSDNLTPAPSHQNANTVVTDWKVPSPDIESTIDTTINYKDLKIKYKPSRVMFGFGTPMDVGFEQEYRIIKNFLNIGLAYHLLFPTEYTIEANRTFVYGSAYLPLNRMMGNYQSQDKGVFLYGHFGYLMYSAKIQDTWGSYTTTVSGGDFSYRMGVDYLFSKTFGISASAYEFKIFSIGIVASIL